MKWILATILMLNTNLALANCTDVLDDRYKKPTWGALYSALKIRYAIRTGCDFNQQIVCNHIHIKVPVSALSCASALGYTDTIQTLLDGKADVNNQDSNGFTALDYAIRYDHQEIIAYLIKAGAK